MDEVAGSQRKLGKNPKRFESHQKKAVILQPVKERPLGIDQRVSLIGRNRPGQNLIIFVDGWKRLGRFRHLIGTIQIGLRSTVGHQATAKPNHRDATHCVHRRNSARMPGECKRTDALLCVFYEGTNTLTDLGPVLVKPLDSAVLHLSDNRNTIARQAIRA